VEGSQVLVKGELHRLHTDDGPTAAVTEDHAAGVPGGGGALKPRKLELHLDSQVSR